MATKQIGFAQLLRQVDETVKNPKEPSYEFSNGRKFTKPTGSK